MHNINVFILSGQFLFFLSIELDVVMETDNELEEKHRLGKVRFSIRNCKTETMSSDEASSIFIVYACFYSCRVKLEQDICHNSSIVENVLIYFFFIFTTKQNHIKSRCIWVICCKAKAIIEAVKIWNSSINGRFQWRSVHVTSSPAPRYLISHRLSANQILPLFLKTNHK